MVSEKTIIILITIAILLSIVSVAVTVSTVKTTLPPVSPPHVNMNKIADTEGAKVSVVVNPPVGKPK